MELEKPRRGSVTSITTHNDESIHKISNHLQFLLLGSSEAPLIDKKDGSYGSSDDYLEQVSLVISESLESNQLDNLLDRLKISSQEKEEELENACRSCEDTILGSVDDLVKVNQKALGIQEQILDIDNRLHQSGEELVEHKKAYIEAKQISDRIDELSLVLSSCLQVLDLTNKVHEMIRQKQQFSALKALNELQEIHLGEVMQYDFAKHIYESLPTLRNIIKEDVLNEVKTLLLTIDRQSAEIGSVAMSRTAQLRKQWKTKTKQNPSLKIYAVNSPVEVSLRERDNFSITKMMNIDLKPILNAIFVFEYLGEEEELCKVYKKEWLKRSDKLSAFLYKGHARSASQPTAPVDPEPANMTIDTLRTLTERLCAFTALERTIMQTTRYKLSSESEIEYSWSSTAQKYVRWLNSFVSRVQTADELMVIRENVGEFLQVAESYGYDPRPLHGALVDVFRRYSQLLHKTFTEHFQESLMEDDAMPMVINSEELYNKIIKVSWYKPDPAELAKPLPRVLPFSQLFPVCCAQIRNFINSHYKFAEDFLLSNPAEIDALLRNSVNYVLEKLVCETLLVRLEQTSREQMAQTLINLGFFISASKELTKTLNESSLSSKKFDFTLPATAVLQKAYKQAEQRVFRMVNEKMEDFLELADWNWTSTVRKLEPSEYVVDLANYLEVMISSTFVNLPESIKGSLYHDALSHLAQLLLRALLDTGPVITREALDNFDLDVAYLEKFVSNLSFAWDNTAPDAARTTSESLVSTFAELRQAITLLKVGSPEEYRDPGIRMRKYNLLKPAVAQELFSKFPSLGRIPSRPSSPASESFSTSKFGSISKYYKRNG